MSLQQTRPGSSIGAQRGEVVVCIPVRDAYDHFIVCLRSVLAHTPVAIPILIGDDASGDGRIATALEEIEAAGQLAHEVHLQRQQSNVGFPSNVNYALRACAPADLVVVNSDCVVAAGWIEGLREAAASDSRVATVSTLTNNGTIVSVPERGRPSPQLPAGWTLEAAAEAVRARSQRLRPRLPTAIGHCFLIRRRAVDLVGEFDLAFSPGYGEEVDFSQRCLRSGLCHVLADDVLVFHHGSASFGVDEGAKQVRDEHERTLKARYPYYHQAVRALEADRTGPLPRALSSARRALKGTSVLIDARVLAGPLTGTQIQVLEVLAALGRGGRGEIAAVLPDHPGDYALQTLRALPHVRLMGHDEAAASSRMADVVHRPYQVARAADLEFLARLGERLIVTNQDLIAFHNPSYFADGKAWLEYRRLTRTTLAGCDHVVFISEHGRGDALAEDLLDPARASVVPNGVDHSSVWAGQVPVPPRGAARIPEGAEVMLCLGTDFRHKNRVFALRMLDRLQAEHGWGGWLILAGPPVARGSSAPEEAELMALNPRLAERVLELPAVSDAEKDWLLDRARVILYPTVQEGFGLVPFEAAERGVPCLWAAGTSLEEVLPPEAATLLPWDASASAERAMTLLRDEAARAGQVDQVSALAKELTWDRAAASLLELYDRVCDAPAVARGLSEGPQGLLRGAVSEDAMRLVGPGGAIPVDVERPLLALATHRALSAPVFGVMKLGYRLGYGLGRIGKRGAAPTPRALPPRDGSAANDLESVG